MALSSKSSLVLRGKGRENLPRLAGVVCTSGALGSHLAIVTREFSIPALMGTKMKTTEDLNQRRVIIQPSDGPGGFLPLSDDN